MGLARSAWVDEVRVAMEAGRGAAAAAGEDDGEEEEEDVFVGPQLPEGAAPGDRGNWGGALRPGASPSQVYQSSRLLKFTHRLFLRHGPQALDTVSRPGSGVMQ